MTQQQYFLLNQPKQFDSIHSIWNIPLCIRGDDAPLRQFFSTEQDIHFVSKHSYLKLNENQSSIYRSLYPTNWNMPQELYTSVTDTLGHLNDLFAFSISGHSSTHNLIKFMKTLINSSDYMVWKTIANILDSIYSMIWEMPQNLKHQFQLFVSKMFGEIAINLSWENKKEAKNELEELLRGLVLSMSSLYGSER